MSETTTRRPAAPATSYDAIVVGGGHNGLTNAAYLAKAGLRTLVLEQRHLVGGAAITEELRPGFSFTTFSYALSLLRPEIIHELDLVEHGFLPLMMPGDFHPTGDGDYLLFGDDDDQNVQMIRRHSRHDADAYTRYNYDLDRVIQTVRPLFDNPPPEHLRHRPRGPGRRRLDAQAPRQRRPEDDPRHRADADRQRGRPARRLLRVRAAQGLPRVVLQHRQPDRPDVRRVRAGAALPQDGRARRAPRVVVVPQGRQRRVHPGARSRGPVVRRRDRARTPTSTGC